MADQGPFANWPHLDKPPRPERSETAHDVLLLPSSDKISQETNQMASNNTLENFLGGSPLNILARLFVISLVVGALLMWLELRPIDIFRGVQAFFDRIYQLGFGAVRELVSYVLAGAIFVVPAWLVLRLVNVGASKR
ncbi:hypothetical protein C5688_01625 [Methylocystis sp. MitZ-2018]|uniref:DUF6460 domain-containing protein n=1 Tax=Methylocystis rosea TaxID=173366 RepID=A0ABX6EHJ3_9HYPH|nr:DUF6460 domain-containing protein [Methylocystis rosea]PWB92359.1 hypothetical protein C5688_01625 [Methylocystis sp. MitZ-2018]QGM94099.1 hypothetical protein F7D13_08710 [Methylocystis rosea]